jgi:hypothetical protein
MIFMKISHYSSIVTWVLDQRGVFVLVYRGRGKKMEKRLGRPLGYERTDVLHCL